MNGTYAFALAAGMAATVNPCGFALLPAYLAAFIGIEHRGGRAGAVGRALTVSLALTAGFVLVFGAFGLIISPLAVRIEQYLPWATVVIGFGLLGLGVALLAGRQLMIRIPKLQKGGQDGTLPSMFLFGVSYAVASLSCTIGPFLAVTTSTFRSESWLDRTRRVRRVRRRDGRGDRDPHRRRRTREVGRRATVPQPAPGDEPHRRRPARGRRRLRRLLRLVRDPGTQRRHR